ncbi:dihydrolipoyl dehydrogenase [Paenibacillus lutimineralis]|uniref:Dihydrolipoyl dehydrogenase n=1 Tax=Paenibacillus lutimineralis TaxID=2707005 RepID=A0A3Q9ID13_9BACL|nr:dihydrolipoyl dehydrogenase [Paenibacillus lutimineralis]AZS16317.1 dihydrolipoyl dehydrogenase [Paenibacillus lutimineralis]
MSQHKQVDTLVIGSGPGGYTAAVRSAQLGMKTIVIERGQIGGVCTNVGCIPSKALIAESHRYNLYRQWSRSGASDFFAEAQAFKQSVVNKQSGGVQYLLQTAGVTVLEGEANLIDKHTAMIKQSESEQLISFKYAILATGSRPIELRALPLGGRILSSTEALALSHIPASLVVIGGGYIGVELGQMYAKFGSKVTILEGGRQVLPGFEADLVAPVIKQMNIDGMTVVTEATAVKAEQDADGLTLHYIKNEEQHFVRAEYALVTVGRRPNTDGSLGLERIGLPTTSKGLIETDEQCRTVIPNIFAIGDITDGPALAHKASYEAKVAAEVIAGQPSVVDYKAIPLVVFSEPELASVGLSETECTARAIPVVIGKSSFGINGRALALKATEGFVKVIANSESGMVIGAQIVGAEASTLISELTLAIEMGATVEDLAMTIHPHPTLGEVIMEAAGNAVRKISKNKNNKQVV